MKRTNHKCFLSPISSSQSEQKSSPLNSFFDSNNILFPLLTRKFISPSCSTQNIRVQQRKDKQYVQTINDNIHSRNKKCKIFLPLNNLNLKLNLHVKKNVPIYVETNKLKQTIEINTTSNFNNKYNVFYKKRKTFMSPKSKMYEERYKLWNDLFMKSLKKQKDSEGNDTHKKVVFNKLLPNIMLNKSKSTTMLLSKL